MLSLAGQGQLSATLGNSHSRPEGDTRHCGAKRTPVSGRGCASIARRPWSAALLFLAHARQSREGRCGRSAEHRWVRRARTAAPHFVALPPQDASVVAGEQPPAGIQAASIRPRITRCQVAAARYRTFTVRPLRSRKVVAIKVHHLVPGRHKVTHERLLRVAARIDFRDGSEL